MRLDSDSGFDEEPIGYPKTSVNSYRYRMRNIPEERRYRIWQRFLRSQITSTV